MDTKIPWYLRLATRFHLLYCVWCRRYAAQLRFLSRASKEFGAEECQGETAGLSPQSKAQMRARLHDAMKDAPPPA